MVSFTEEGYLREKVRTLRRGLMSRLDEFVEDFPTGQSANLIGIIKTFLDQVEIELGKCDHINLLRLFCRLIDALASVLEWLDHAHTAETPRVCVEILREIADKIHQGSAIIVTPTIDSNYFISDERPDLERFTSALSESGQAIVLAKFPSSIYRVRFPRLERENILNHSLFGHEFGHPIADKYLADHETEIIYQKRLNNAQMRVQNQPAIAKELLELEDDTDRTGFLNHISNKLAEIHKRALVELVSDAIAIHLFGPSALFSAVDLFIREGIDDLPTEQDDYYPPTRYRWRFMMQILKEEGHLKELNKLRFTQDQNQIETSLSSVLKYLTRVVNKTDDLLVLQSDPYVDAAYGWLKKTLPRALRYARQRVATMIYRPATMAAEVSPLLQRLGAGVPPSEVGSWPNIKPVDWRSTMAASWLVALSQMFDQKQSADKRQDLVQTTHRLAMKAVEYVFMQRDFKTFKQSRANVV